MSLDFLNGKFQNIGVKISGFAYTSLVNTAKGVPSVLSYWGDHQQLFLMRQVASYISDLDARKILYKQLQNKKEKTFMAHLKV